MRVKIKTSLAIAFALVGVLFNQARAQEYKLRSFEGDEKLIRVLPSYEHDLLKIICLNDTLYIENVTNIETTTLLNKSFLMVTYSVRSGTGMHLTQTSIFSVNNKRLYESLHITSFFKDDFIDFSKPIAGRARTDVKTRYSVALGLDEIPDYKLNARIHHERKSNHASRSDYNYNRSARLKFDRKQNIFYSSMETVPQRFEIFDVGTGRYSKRRVNGTFPVIAFGSYRYYYINNEWYEQFEHGHLSKYTNRGI